MILTPWDPDPQSLLTDADMQPVEPHTPSRGERIALWLSVAVALGSAVAAGWWSAAHGMVTR